MHMVCTATLKCSFFITTLCDVCSTQKAVLIHYERFRQQSFLLSQKKTTNIETIDKELCLKPILENHRVNSSNNHLNQNEWRKMEKMREL